MKIQDCLERQHFQPGTMYDHYKLMIFSSMSLQWSTRPYAATAWLLSSMELASWHLETLSSFPRSNHILTQASTSLRSNDCLGYQEVLYLIQSTDKIRNLAFTSMP